jgi:Fur family ferric uptake transcriptional regulator
MSSSITKALKDAGQSVTRPRLQVFEALHRADGPVAVSALASLLEAEVDRASVYRTVALFRRLGFVRDVAAGWRPMVELGDRFDPHHHHLTCTDCGRSAVFEDKRLEDELVKLALDQGYLLESHQVELTGRCAACRRKIVDLL